jgi:hypothetical protein
VNRVLLFMAVLLLAFIGWRWFNPLAEPRLEALPPPGADGGDIEKLLKSMDRVAGFPTLAAYSAISNRPLFFSKRRPPPPYIADKTGGKKPGPTRRTGKPRVQLSAIISIGNQTYALVQGGKKKGARRVRLGDEIDGWTVAAIDKDKLVLRNGSETETLLLWNYRPVKPVKQTPKKPAKPRSGTDKNRKPEAAPPSGSTPRR